MLFRLIIASFYDLLIVLALLMLITAICLLSTHQEFIPASTRWYQFLLLAIMLAYYLLCFKFGGQTIGFKAWHLQLITSQGYLTLLHVFLWLFLVPLAIAYGFVRLKSPQYFLFKWTKVIIIKVEKNITEKL